MTKERDLDRWTAVDRYIGNFFTPPDAALDQVLIASEEAGLPAIAVSPPQGKMLHLLARSIGARRILEIGTLGGYSAIWLARALPPGGKLVTLESDAKHAGVARANIAAAGLADQVDVLVGPAIETLPRLVAEQHQPFDFVFIDADKPSTADYFVLALKLTRVGSIIVVDNVVRDGEVTNPKTTDPNALGIRRFNAVLAAERRVSGTEIQTVGSKGYDGFALALVVGR
ncbi:MAG TPA: O-methyltransferase [Gemmatimonadales bacterium]